MDRLVVVPIITRSITFGDWQVGCLIPDDYQKVCGDVKDGGWKV